MPEMLAPDENTKLEVLNDHYKDTFASLQEFRQVREQLFFLILAVTSLMLFQVFSPKEAGDAIGQFISKTLDLQAPIDVSFVGSVIWFGLLGLVVRYFQTVVHIERQYEYIHGLEKQLGRIYDDKAFTREGKFYLANYPLFSNWASMLYTIVFPVLLVIVIATKIVHEIYLASHVSPLLVFNITISLFILTSTVLYLLTIHRRK